MKKTLSALILGTALITTPALSWESLDEMNKTVDHTNFIVGSGCSGTLISKTDRLIVTAYHCIDRYLSYVTKEETTPDGEIKKVRYEKRSKVPVAQKNYEDYEQVGSITYQTEILDYDKTRDLALLQLVGKDLRSEMAATILHKDETLQRGQGVIAVGNPRMLDNSVTTGVISSLNRKFKSMTDKTATEEVPMIQYDAAGAPGSSGGALFTSEGKYIGTTVAGIAGEFVLAIPYFVLWDLLEKNCFAELFDPAANDLECRGETFEPEATTQE